MIIYKVTNKKTGMSYIGQTVRTLKTRRAEHLQASANIARSKYPAPLHKALSEFGSAEFEWTVLEEDVTELNDRERHYIRVWNTLHPNGYNQTVGGAMDEMMSAAIRDKIANSMVNLHKDSNYTARIYPKLKGLIPPNKGIEMTPAQKEKLRAAKLAQYADPNYINPNVGQKRTGETLDNLKKSLKNRKMPTGDAWTKAHANQYTLEVKAKMRAAKLNKKPANTKQILCIETNQVFQGLTDASIALGVNRQSIYLQIKGKIKAAGGLHFKYLD